MYREMQCDNQSDSGNQYYSIFSTMKHHQRKAARNNGSAAWQALKESWHSFGGRKYGA
jgi:hypothetical protein